MRRVRGFCEGILWCSLCNIFSLLFYHVCMHCFMFQVSLHVYN
jgi:hypothetical protein